MILPVPLVTLPISDLRDIVQSRGIYYLLNGKRVVYIGYSTKNLQARIRAHINAGRPFSHISWHNVDASVPHEMLLSIERALIQFWRPAGNKRHKIKLATMIESAPEDFIGEQNKRLNAQIADLTWQLEQSQHEAQQLKLKLTALEAGIPMPPNRYYSYIGGVIHLDGEEVLLQSSNYIQELIPKPHKKPLLLKLCLPPKKEMPEPTKPENIVSFPKRVHTLISKLFGKA